MTEVLAGMEAGTEISELCRVEEFNPTQKNTVERSSWSVVPTRSLAGGKDDAAAPDPHEWEMICMRGDCGDHA